MRHPAEHSPLSKTNEHASSYTPSLLFPILRMVKQAEFGLSAETLSYRGVDIWNCYELSWPTPAGKPAVAIGEFPAPADLPNIIESKSFKLYLNSLNQSVSDNHEVLRMVLGKDLSSAAGTPAGVHLHSLDEVAEKGIGRLPGRYIGELDIAVDGYEQPHPELPRRDAGRIIEEQLHSRLLKPNCLVTGQPGWNALVVNYQGPALDPVSPPAYLASSRQRQDSHEQCIGRIFLDLQRLLQPQALGVYACYVRRDDLGISPYRNLAEVTPDNRRLVRQ